MHVTHILCMPPPDNTPLKKWSFTWPTECMPPPDDILVLLPEYNSSQWPFTFLTVHMPPSPPAALVLLSADQQSNIPGHEHPAGVIYEHE